MDFQILNAVQFMSSHPPVRPVKFPNIWKVFSRFILNFLLKVLNAKPENVEREAEIVAQSGRLGAVTIATNMAGRGTDIILGGNAEFMARLKLREMLMPRYLKYLLAKFPNSIIDAASDYFPLNMPKIVIFFLMLLK